MCILLLLHFDVEYFNGSCAVKPYTIIALAG